ncbi:MAG: GGDEF domain-containing protein [Terracidiphilus sp.]|jgi:diguanylate cyclase (GGDEF)-like protein
MKRFVLAFAIILGWASTACAVPPGALTSLRAIRSLTDAQARLGLPVAFEATVTYYDNNGVDLFVQQDSQAIYVESKPHEGFVPGDRVLVHGKTRNSFGTDVIGDSIILIRHNVPIKPVRADFVQLIHAERDCMLVTLHATVRSANTVRYENLPSIYLKLLMDGGSVDAMVIDSGGGKLESLLGAEVEVTGVVSGLFDSKMQLAGIMLQLSSLADVKVLKRGNTNPYSLPITPMDKVLSAYYVRDETHRVRVQGTITYYQPGSAVVLQSGSKSLWISTQTSDPLRVGDRADATGFPEASKGVLSLADGDIQDSHIYEPIAPQPSTWPQLAIWTIGSPFGHQDDLVSIEGQIVTAVREASQDEFVLISDGKLFTAIYRHPLTGGPLPAMKQVPLGATVRVTGICVAVHASSINYGAEEEPFNILLRSFDDLTIVRRPSLLSVRNLILLVGLLLAVVLVVVVRGWALERRVRRQALAMASRTEMEADLERRRSSILEDINGSRPLASIVEEIAALVSSRLGNVPCWCEIAEGARLGEYPTAVNSLRVLHEEIPARTGPALGTLFAAFNPETQLGGTEKGALLVGARLATLAIETRRMNADLLHRSEFDQLTDIHNRFSLGKNVDALIKTARQNAAIFGLIYIDLDDFKQVNDIYGHHIGDLYLQEASRRMKLQLRSHDLLARLGGDEFVALLPTVRNRADVEEISGRLEHCFNDPLVLKGHTLKGSASFGIAIYPEDSATTDGLLNAADAAMYAVKRRKKEFAGTRRTALES